MFNSPTDNMMTPCTQKLSAVKKKHFAKFVVLDRVIESSLTPLLRSAKPVQLFSSQKEDEETNVDESEPAKKPPSRENSQMGVDDENPF